MGRPGMYICGVKPPRKYSFTPFKLVCAQQTKTMLIVSGNSSCAVENSCWHTSRATAFFARSDHFFHSSLSFTHSHLHHVFHRWYDDFLSEYVGYYYHRDDRQWKNAVPNATQKDFSTWKRTQSQSSTADAQQVTAYLLWRWCCTIFLRKHQLVTIGVRYSWMNS